jgi:hypothetical protein
MARQIETALGAPSLRPDRRSAALGHRVGAAKDSTPDQAWDA